MDYAITNRLGRAISLLALPTCGCQSVQVSDRTVRPDATAFISVVYDPKMLPLGDSSKSVTVQVSGNDRGRQFSLPARFSLR